MQIIILKTQKAVLKLTNHAAVLALFSTGAMLNRHDYTVPNFNPAFKQDFPQSFKKKEFTVDFQKQRPIHL